MRNNPVTRWLSAGFGGCLVAAASATQVSDCAAQPYPTQTISIHVAYDADTSADNRIASVMQPRLSARLRVDVSVVTPKRRAAKAASKIVGSSASGYQVMLGGADSHFFAGIDDAEKSSRPLSLLGVIADSPMLCVVNAQSPFNSLADLFTHLKRDQKLRISSAGRSSHSHVMAQLVMRAGEITTRLNHLGLKSPAAALAAVLKGTAQFTCISAVLAKPLVERRQLKTLVASSSVSGIEAPTAKELGFAGFEVLDESFTIAGSERIKADVVNAWQRALTQLSQDPVFVTQATQLGFRAGRESLMLRSQANAVLANKRAALRELLRQYGLKSNIR